MFQQKKNLSAEKRNLIISVFVLHFKAIIIIINYIAFGYFYQSKLIN